MKIKNIKQNFTKTTHYTRAKDGKFTSGSGGLKALKNFNWKRATPVIAVVALVGGYLVYNSFAAGQPACEPGSVSGQKYLFLRCRYDNKAVVPDACVIRWAINPGRLKGKNIPYESETQKVTAEIAKYMGVQWKYVGQVNYKALERPAQNDDVVLIDYSAQLDDTILQYRPGGAEAIVRMNYAFRNNHTVTHGSTVSIYLDFIEREGVKHAGAVSVGTIEKGPLTASNFSRRMNGLLGHEIAHTVGLADIYRNGNANGIIDTTQRMGSLKQPWGAGDMAGLRKAGAESRNLTKCYMPPNASNVSQATATKEVELAYAGLLGRKPEGLGKKYWENALMLQKVDADSLVKKIALVPESKKIFQSQTTPAAKVQKIYAIALCRNPSRSELSYWSNSINKQGFEASARLIAATQEAQQIRAATPVGTKICR